METEIPALLRAREPEAPDERFTFHSSRMRMRQVTPEELRSMNEQTGRARPSWPTRAATSSPPPASSR